MKDHEEIEDSGGQLRKGSKQAVVQGLCDPAHPAREGVQRLVQELEVYRIELEMQNNELRQVRQDLERSLSRCVLLYDCAPVGLAIIDSNGRIIEMNHMAAGILGLPKGDTINPSFCSSLAKRDRRAFRDDLKQCIQQHSAYIAEMTLDGCGGQRVIQVHCRPGKDVDGKTVCLMAVLNIADGQQAERDI